MPDIPIEIQIQIIKNLPIKSLIRCTSLSKLFNAIIKSSTFITDHSLRQNQQLHLLTWYETNINQKVEIKYVSIIDNVNFPQNKSPITIPETLNRIDPMLSIVLSSSHGLLCLRESNIVKGDKCFIWNLSIRRCIVIPIPNASDWIVGFGVCPNSSDPKLVKIRGNSNTNSTTYNPVNWDVEIYSVSSGVWKTVPNDKPCKLVSSISDQVVINGTIYWLASDYSSIIRNERHRFMIITFDLTSEKIGEVYLPDSLAYSFGDLFISKRMESLAVINDYEEGDQQVCDVWIMDHGVPNTYEKLFTFKVPKGSSDRVIGFRKNDQPILLRYDSFNGERFEVYNPSSQQFTNLEVFGNGNPKMVVTLNSLTQTLLLIDQPNSIFINEANNHDDDDDDDGNDDDADNDGNDDDDENDDDDATTGADVLIAVS